VSRHAVNRAFTAGVGTVNSAKATFTQMGGSTTFRRAAATVALLLAAQAFPAGCYSTPRPSVLLVVVDTLRADHLGAYGAPAGATPALDAFAREALVFEDAVSTAPFTMPAVAAMMTGRYPDRVGISNHTRRDRLSKEATPVAELARATGYCTGAVVTNPWLANSASGFARGFEHFVTGRSLGSRKARMTAAAVTDQALELIANCSADRPFFLWAHYMDTHMPYQPPLELAADHGVPSGTTDVVRDFVEDPTRRQSIYFEAPYSPEALESTRALYAASVSNVDRQIGRLLAGLSGVGRAPTTIVAIVADHGESLGDHGLWFAHDFTLYQELISVPLMLRIPGGMPARISQPVSSMDLAPTLCRLADLGCDEDLDGRTLPLAAAADRPARLLFAAGVPARDRYERNPWLAVAGVDGRWTMVRSGRRKLIRVPQAAGPTWQLYDLDVDPSEASDAYAPDTTIDLQTALEQWIERMRRARASTENASARLDRATRDELRQLGYLD